MTPSTNPGSATLQEDVKADFSFLLLVVQTSWYDKDGQVPLPHFYVSVDSFLCVNIYVKGLYGAQSFCFYT